MQAARAILLLRSFSIENMLVPVYQIFMDTLTSEGAVLWQTGYGQPMLTSPNKSTFIFHSRLQPKWNGLVWSEVFPQQVVKLLYPEQQVKGWTIA